MGRDGFWRVRSWFRRINNFFLRWLIKKLAGDASDENKWGSWAQVTWHPGHGVLPMADRRKFVVPTGVTRWTLALPHKSDSAPYRHSNQTSDIPFAHLHLINQCTSLGFHEYIIGISSMHTAHMSYFVLSHLMREFNCIFFLPWLLHDMWGLWFWE